MEHGKVTTVNYENGVVYCNVQAIRLNTEYQDVPVLKSHSGFIQIPKQGETVAMDQLRGEKRFISHVISREAASPDDMKEGELAIQLDGGTRAYFSEKSNGDYDLHLDASGDVFIDGTKFSEHVHSYTDDETADTEDGSGSTTTQAKTTEPPE